MLLAREDELDLTGRALETLEKLGGVRPVGIRTPSWDFSDHTLAIIEELGLAYDSSLMADDEPYELLADGRPTGIVEIPVEWIRDDAPYLMMERYGALRPYTPPRQPARHLARRVRRRVRRGWAVPAHPAPAHHRAPFPARRPARAARAHHEPLRRLARHPCADRRRARAHSYLRGTPS